MYKKTKPKKIWWGSRGEITCKRYIEERQPFTSKMDYILQKIEISGSVSSSLEIPTDMKWNIDWDVTFQLQEAK